MVATIAPVASVSSVSSTEPSVAIVGLGLSLSLTLAVISPAVTQAVSTISSIPTVASISSVAIVGLSLGLSFSLAVVSSSVTKTVSSISSIPTVASVSTVSTVAIVRLSGSLGLSISLCFGFRLRSHKGRQGENYEHLHVASCLSG